MFALARLIVFGFAILTVIYVILSVYSRSVRRGKLIREWGDRAPIQDREKFVDQGLKEYDGSLRRKLILGVYIVPVCVVALMVYLTNFH